MHFLFHVFSFRELVVGWNFFWRMVHVNMILVITMKQLISFWNPCSSVMNLWYSFSCSYPSSLQGCPSKLLFNSPFLQQSCGSGMLADGRLADLIRRVATFGMVLMKLDLRQVWLMFCSLLLGQSLVAWN